MNLFKRFRIQQIFFGSFFLFFTIFLTIIIIVTYHYSVEEMITTTTDYQKENLTLLTEDLSNNLKNYDDISIVLSRQKAFREALRGSDDPYIRRTLFSTLTQDFSNIIYSVPGLHSLEVYMETPPYNIINQPIHYAHLYTIEHKDWSEQIKNRTHTWIGKRKVRVNNSKEQEVISLSRNVYSTKGDLEAILVLNIQSSQIENWLNRKQRNSNLLLLDSNGATIASSSEVEVDRKILSLAEESAQNIQEQRSLMQQVEQKAEFIVVTSLIPSSNWSIMEITPYEELTKGSKMLTGFLALIGLGSLMTAFIGTFFLTKRFTDPIIYLTRVLEKFPKENISSELPTDYRNEFGQLYKGYRELIHRSETLYTSLLEQSRRQREAELKALQANINPHFLYNTLDQLNWSALERGDEDMSQMLELLGNMLRIGLSKGESIITVHDELKYVEYYLKLQKIKMGNRLSYRIDAAESVLGYYVPKLTLQPFVENSIIHGFHDQRDGLIEVVVEENADSLVFSVFDNGVGINEANRSKEKMDTGGYGTVNVQERLDIYFGERASVTVKNRTEGGAVATIVMPKVLDKEAIQLKEYNQDELFRENRFIENES
ncbi:cache domain-containing sensor histidine kinase [Halalkalibacter urbisdiaboli]|uniref:cache domain-containing sensor histidine kinase n=1 Tax=Halalkalibacter urbisdiaboli TaxID=1960589 RepID=UPI000B450700|nr:sensor histidine kinase [Halalkalibacter urbisdiaboli]